MKRTACVMEHLHRNAPSSFKALQQQPTQGSLKQSTQRNLEQPKADAATHPRVNTCSVSQCIRRNKGATKPVVKARIFPSSLPGEWGAA